MFGIEFSSGFGSVEQADRASIEALVRAWWPLIALVLGVFAIVAGAILFTP